MKYPYVSDAIDETQPIGKLPEGVDMIQTPEAVLILEILGAFTHTSHISRGEYKALANGFPIKKQPFKSAHKYALRQKQNVPVAMLQINPKEVDYLFSVEQAVKIMDSPVVEKVVARIGGLLMICESEAVANTIAEKYR